jgi:hypothetical protein
VKGPLNEIINSVGYNTKIMMGGCSMEAEEIVVRNGGLLQQLLGPGPPFRHVR